MAMDYLQYMQFVRPDMRNSAPLRFLVSGVDAGIRTIVGEHVLTSAYTRGLPLFVLDNTGETREPAMNFGHYRVVDVLNGDVSLCKDLLTVDSLRGISRLRSLLSDLGFDGNRSMKVVSYLKFVEETERRLGNSGPLTVKILEAYGGAVLVEWRLNHLVETGKLTEENRQYLLGRYAEVSGAAADFELFLVLLAPFMGDRNPAGDMALYLPLGEFRTDKPMQNMLCKLLLSYIKQRQSESVVLILDDGNGDCGCIVDVLKNLPAAVEVHMFSEDAFGLGEADRGIVMNKFNARIYTRHENMDSCEKIEKHCGDVDVVKRSSSTTVDHRFRNNSAWDLLLGTNRSDTEIINVPVREPRFRKEYVQSLLPGVGVVDFDGNQILLNFS